MYRRTEKRSLIIRRDEYSMQRKTVNGHRATIPSLAGEKVPTEVHSSVYIAHRLRNCTGRYSPDRGRRRWTARHRRRLFGGN